MHWTQRPGSLRIELRGPLGSGLVRLQQDAGGATLTDNGRNVYRAESIEDLLFDATGWHIPLDGLTYWIRGLNRVASRCCGSRVGRCVSRPMPATVNMTCRAA